jgi:hypothetical protein
MGVAEVDCMASTESQDAIIERYKFPLIIGDVFWKARDTR